MRYRERLYPSPGLMLALSLSFPMLLLAALPFGGEIGILVALAGSLLITGTFVITAPSIAVTDTYLLAGRFRLPISVIGQTQELTKKELSALIGPEADARAQLMIRGYVKTALKIEIVDSEDPTPYIVISTRRPKELSVALLANRS